MTASEMAAKLWASLSADPVQREAFIKRRNLKRWGKTSSIQRKRLMRRVTLARMRKRRADNIA